MDFNFQLNSLIYIRKNFKSLLSNFSEAQLNTIPDRFRNNLAWNYGHVVIIQQLICYNRSNLDLLPTAEQIQFYKNGSVPDRHIPISEIEALTDLSKQAIIKLQEDMKAGVFVNYKPLKTILGLDVNSIEAAIQFNNTHEAIHLGISMSMAKVV